MMDYFIHAILPKSHPKPSHPPKKLPSPKFAPLPQPDIPTCGIAEGKGEGLKKGIDKDMIEKLR